ncbi:MAG TPA: hypothetical protein VLD38_08155 [Nitrosopumilaceae archaeon]|nr:hypothetical protein [Nitrosopumilaceae archaeon]
MVNQNNFLPFGIIFLLALGLFPVFAEDELEDETMSEQQKKEFENTLTQIEMEKEIANKQEEISHESEVDEDDEQGFSILGGGTSGLILAGTIASILGVVGYAGYKVFSIRKMAHAKRKASFEGIPK